MTDRDALVARVREMAERLKKLIRHAYTGDSESESRTRVQSMSMNPNPHLVVEDFEAALGKLADALARETTGTCATCRWAGKPNRRTYRDCHHPKFQEIGSDTPIVPARGYGCTLHEPTPPAGS